MTVGEAKALQAAHGLAQSGETVTSGLMVRGRTPLPEVVFVSYSGIPHWVTDSLKNGSAWVFASVNPQTSEIKQISEKQYRKLPYNECVFIHRSIIDRMNEGKPLTLSVDCNISGPTNHVLAGDYIHQTLAYASVPAMSRNRVLGMLRLDNPVSV